MGSGLASIGLLAVTACAVMGLPRIEDSPAPREYYEQTTTAESTCSPPVELLRSASEVVRPYREVATLSATCYPGTPRLCEQRLKERACELKAEAIILMAPTPGGTPSGASTQSQVSLSGRAVRWKQE